jgi:hypothetical protein
MTDRIKYTRAEACRIMAQGHCKIDRQAESDMTAHGGFRPEPYAGQVLYGEAELIALDRQLTRREEGLSVRVAGEEAARLHRAMTAHPDAERLALVTLLNGSRFALPADQVDLASGYSSGAPVREALFVDVRNLRARIVDMIEAAGRIVGEADDEG